MIEILHEDCMAVMARYPDNHFDMAIVDPPYGIGVKGQSGAANTDRWRCAADKCYHSPEWDNRPPESDYFDELKRVSKDQIIWGANYYSEVWPSKGIICWDKKTTGNYSSFELAATSFDRPAAIFQWLWSGFKKQQPEHRIHPTQKPVQLYKWLLRNYAKEGDKILDTHGGSMSSAIAAHYGGFDMVICELDKDYYEAGKARFEQETRQEALF